MLGQEKIDTIYALRKEGKTYQQIGKVLGITKQRVYQLFKRSGLTDPFPVKSKIEIKIKPVHIVEQHKDEIIKLYNKGLTLPKIAKQLFPKNNYFYKSSIPYFLVKWGVANRRKLKGTIKETMLNNKEQIIDMYNNGMTLKDIRFSLGLENRSFNLYPLLEEWGVQVRKPRLKPRQ